MFKSPLWNLTLQSALASAYDFASGIFYLVDDSFQLWSIDIHKREQVRLQYSSRWIEIFVSNLIMQKSIIFAVPAGYVPINVVRYWIGLDIPTNSIYGWVQDTWGNASIFQINLAVQKVHNIYLFVYFILALAILSFYSHIFLLISDFFFDFFSRKCSWHHWLKILRTTAL